uniref:C2 domain-containing protein n=1 Tax=Phaeocystis antarctica TaxID=33657 RepID=A0A7S0HMQ7_9EUKA
MLKSTIAAGLVGVTGVAGVTMLAKKVSALGEARKLQRGPCCILEIGGCELVEAANQGFDWKDPFGGIISDGRPDLRVTWTHGSTSGETQTENNTYHAVWMSSLKIPFDEKKGFVFQVVDVDLLNGNDVIGRCYCSNEDAREAMRTDEPLVLSLGESIGKLKVSMHGPMKFAHSVLSPEGQANHEHLASKRAGPKAPGAKAASAPPPQSPPATAAVAGYPAATAAAVAATTVAAAPVAPKSSAQQK